MKIVLVGPVYPYKGGIAHYTSLLYKTLAAKHDIELISYKMQYPKILYKQEQKDYANDFFKINSTRFLINSANPFNIFCVAKQINKMMPDIVLLQWWHPYFAPCYRILISNLNKKIKVLFTCHNVFPHERFPMDRLLTKLTLEKGNGFIVHSESDKRDLLSLKPTANIIFNPHPTYNVFKIRNINKTEARSEIFENDGFMMNEKTKVLLFFGFIREYKGLKYLIDAMPEILKQFEDCKLLVVGTFGEDKQKYIDQICRNKVSDCIYLKDTYTPDGEVEKYFMASDLIVLPYEDATQSGIVQIAFGFEKPVLVTNVGGLPDVVDDGKTGYVVSPCNPQAIAEKVIEFYDKHMDTIFKKGIKEEAYRFSWNHMCESIEELVENIK